MTSAFETILLSKSGDVAEIALNRPRVLNAYNIQMRDDMSQALEAVRYDPDVRCVLLRGEGDRAFCTGADLTEFGTAPSRVIARQVRWERDVWGQFLSLDKPIVAALHGFVIGSGIEMAMLCDIRFASDDAVFGLPEAALGMLPAAGGTQTIPRMIGRSRALEALLSNERMDASRALDIGLVHRVVSKETLLEEARAQAEELAGRPARLVKSIKETLRRGLDLPLERALELETSLAAAALAIR